MNDLVKGLEERKREEMEYDDSIQCIINQCIVQNNVHT